jgi:purine catabolism regulator
MITVKKMVDLLSFDNIKLVAGHEGLDSVVDYINVQEIQSKSPWMKANGFIMTTFYAFHHNLEEIINHLTWYLDMKVSAVGFHTAVQEIPQEILDFANEHKLPLFSMPPQFPYYIVFERVNNYLIEQTLQFKEQTDKINESMLQAVILEKDTHHIIHMMGNFLQTPAVFIDGEMNLLSLWSNSTYTRSEIQKVVEKMIENEFSLFEQAKLESIYTETKSYEIHSKSISFTIIPLKRDINFFGYLLVAIPEIEIPLHQVVIKHGVTALLLDAIKNNALKEYHKNLDIRQLEDVFQRASGKELNAASFHYNVSEMKYLLLAEPNKAESIKHDFMVLKDILQAVDKHCLLWISNKNIVGIVQKSISKEAAQAIVDKGKGLSLGISDLLSGFHRIGVEKLYDQASFSLEQAKLRTENKFCFWSEIGIEKVIHQLRGNHVLESFDHEVLQPLLNYDLENNSELTKTLYMYLQHFFSLKETGEALYVHPNTVKYRLEKVRELLGGVDFKNAGQYMCLMVALHLHFLKN